MGSHFGNTIFVHVITVARLRAAYKKHPDWEPGLVGWYSIAKRAEWKNIEDVRKVFPSADGVPLKDGRILTVFNVGGNKARLITKIEYAFRLLFIKEVLTHAEYDKGEWKK